MEKPSAPPEESGSVSSACWGFLREKASAHKSQSSGFSVLPHTPQKLDKHLQNSLAVERGIVGLHQRRGCFRGHLALIGGKRTSGDRPTSYRSWGGAEISNPLVTAVAKGENGRAMSI